MILHRKWTNECTGVGQLFSHGSSLAETWYYSAPKHSREQKHSEKNKNKGFITMDKQIYMIKNY